MSGAAVRLGLSVFGGALEFLGFAGFDLYPLTWIALVPGLLAIRGQSPRRALACGFVFGLVTHLGGYHWIAHMLAEFGGIPRPLAWLGLLLLASYQGAAFAIVFWAVRRAEATLGVAPVWTLGVAYPAIEWAYPLIFPYSISASQYRVPALTQVVELTGLTGLTALIGLVNGAVYEVVDARLSGRRAVLVRLAAAAGLFVLVVAYGLARLPQVERQIAAAPRVRVAVIQTNIGARDKDADTAATIARHQEMSRAAVLAHPDVDLLVWPESAYNRWLPRGLTVAPGDVTGGLGRPMIWGALTFRRSPDGRVDTFNTAFLSASDGAIRGAYDKVELVLFGERIPFVDTFPVLRSWLPRTGTFTPGSGLPHLVLESAKSPVSILPMICYEDILPDLVRRSWNTTGPAGLLVNLTNDSWYGNTTEPTIHLALASFRSIETRRALVRATNTGISAVVDPTGRIVARTGQWQRETLVADVPVVSDGRSTLYLRLGDLFAWLACAGTATGTAVAWRRRAAR
jgi:apolipoprotein N-acyltransferase